MNAECGNRRFDVINRGKAQRRIAIFLIPHSAFRIKNPTP